MKTTKLIIVVAILLVFKTTHLFAQEASTSYAQSFVEAFKEDGVKNGFTLVKSGVFNYDPALYSTWRFDVKRREYYLFMAVKEVYDPSFRVDIIYDWNNLMRETNDWNDNGFTVDESTQYGMQYLKSKEGESSVFVMKLSFTKNSNINQIQFSPAGKLAKIYWALLKAN